MLIPTPESNKLELYDLSASYDLKGDGRHRVMASYGKYVSKIADGNVLEFVDQRSAVALAQPARKPLSALACERIALEVVRIRRARIA